MTHEKIEAAKHVVDGLSVTTVLGALVGLLPSIAALFTIVWTALRIYESPTIQGWLTKQKSKKDGIRS